MFVGRHEHSLDPKGRVVLPASFRSAVVDRGYVTTLGTHIGMWDENGFQELTEKLMRLRDEKKLSAAEVKKIIRDTSVVKLDSAGRITLPRALLDELGFRKEVVLTGYINRVEIWPAEVFADVNAKTESNAKMADAINEHGL